MFSVFYEKAEVDFDDIDDSVLIVLDTNVLLHFFRYSEKSKEKLLRALGKVKENLFVPYHAALEYHFGRQTVSRANKKNIDELRQKLEKEKKNFKNRVEFEINSYGSSIRSTDEIETRKDVLDNFSSKLDDFWNNFFEEDLIKETSLISDNSDTLSRIATLLEGKVGSKLSNISDIEKDGIKRYLDKVPPGYEDDNSSKDQIRSFGDYQYNRKFGDLILWKEIIKYCQDHSNIKHVFFITDDAKEDWIYKVDKNQTIGIRVELKQELMDQAGAQIELMKTDTFLSNVIKQDNIFKVIDFENFKIVDRDNNFDLDEYYMKLDQSKDFLDHSEKIFYNEYINRNKSKVLDNIFNETKDLLKEKNSEIDHDLLQLVFKEEYYRYKLKVDEYMAINNLTYNDRHEIIIEIGRLEELYSDYIKSQSTYVKKLQIESIIREIESSLVYTKYKLVS